MYWLPGSEPGRAKASSTFCVMRATLLSQPEEGRLDDHAMEPVENTAPLLRVVKYTMSARTSGFWVPIRPL